MLKLGNCAKVTKIVFAFVCLVICAHSFAMQPGKVRQCITIYEINDMGVSTDVASSSCEWITVWKAHEWASYLNMKSFLDSYYVSYTPGAMQNPFPQWYTEETGSEWCPSDKNCLVHTSPFGPEDDGQPCSVPVGNGNGVLNHSWKQTMECLPDQDGDGIPDGSDDCPLDPTNSDMSCMDDIPDCNAIALTVLGTFGWSSGISLSRLPPGAIVASVKGILLLGTTFGGVTGAIFLVGSAYCIITELENINF